MNSPRPIAVVDIESRSTVDLPERGIETYLTHPSTRPVSVVALLADRCLVWVNAEHYPSDKMPLGALDVGDDYGDPGPVSIDYSRDVPSWLRDLAASHTFVGHNATGFDEPFMRRVMGIDATWIDTLDAARACGLPGGLDAIGEALLGVGKHEGKKVLAQFYNASKPAPWRHLWTLISYNIADCLLTWWLYDEVRQYADDAETALIALHRKINARGVGVDMALRDAMESHSLAAVKHAGEEIERLTGGRLKRDELRSVPKVKAWLESLGFKVANVRRETLAQLISDPEQFFEGGSKIDGDIGTVSPLMRSVLRLRQAATRITGAKLARIEGHVGEDSRLRNMLVYHGAHTGRFTSRVVQLHNLTRGVSKCDVASLLRDGPPSYEAVEAEASRLRAAGLGWVTNDDVLGTLLRYVLVPTPGRKFGIVDYAAIEARGLAWLADETRLLDAFRTGRDVYCDFGARLFGRTITKDADPDERQISKVTVLGAGYGLGSAKFSFYAANAGVDLASVGVTAEQCIEAYRDAYPRIAGALTTIKPRRVGEEEAWEHAVKDALRRHLFNEAQRRYIESQKPRAAAGGVGDTDSMRAATDHGNAHDGLRVERRINDEVNAKLGALMSSWRVGDSDVYELPAWSYRTGGLWRDLASMCFDAVSSPVSVHEVCGGRVRVGVFDGHMHLALPSGRELIYRDARIECVAPGWGGDPRPAVTYRHHHGYRKQLYGGLIAENVVQAMCRDLLCDAMLRLDAAGFDIVAHVHDEIVCELDDPRRIDEMCEIMRTPPAWARGFPIAVEATLSTRYGKVAMQ